VVSLLQGGAWAKVVSIAAAYQSSFVLLANGDVLSWGDNYNSALGRPTGAALNDPSPGQVLGAKGVGVLNLGPVSHYPNVLNRAR
jgi:alpha-tubulin suppressor-like RCC1 family protein